MKLLLSGEGPTDIGTTRLVSGGTEFVAGPMAVIADRVAERRLDFSLLEMQAAGGECVLHFSEGQLASARIPRPMLLPGAHRPPGEAGPTAHAHALGSIARQKRNEADCPVIAILFRDSDGTRSAPHARWENKVAAINQGFELAGFDSGVAMVPRPKSEAWMLCALKDNEYQHCHALEDAPGNDKSPNSLKGRLAARMRTDDLSGDAQAQWVREGRVDPLRIDMPSFVRFRERFERLLPGGLDEGGI